jgi:phospholipid/cholesterol/gamma-HCH transport system permease protein
MEKGTAISQFRFFQPLSGESSRGFLRKAANDFPSPIGWERAGVRENNFDRRRSRFYAAVVRKNLAKAFELTNTLVFRRAPLPRSYMDFLGRKLFLFLLTIQGLGAFALITLGVILKKSSVAHSVMHPRIRHEINRAGIALMPMFVFVALALGFLVVGQTVSALAKVGATDYLGSTMVIVIVRELGPLLTAVLVLARVGTANVIELGTARALGEVEALEALGIDPVHYLIVPRVLGMMAGIFSLTIYLIIGALASGYLWAFLQDVPLTPGDYFKQLVESLDWLDFALLALKTIAFGFFIAIVTCYHGLAQPLRLEDVPRVAVRAVTQGVIVCVLIDALFIVLYLVK